jgi:transcriptional regulator NrdR family protein
VVRKRQCKSCGLEYTTIEVAIPVSFSRIDSYGRDQRKAERRQAQGFKGVQKRKPYTAPSVDVKVTVHDRGKVL